MSGGLRLAAADLAHAAVLAALHARCFDDAWSVRAMTEVLGAPGVFAYLALAGGTAGDDCPVGFALARRTGDDAELLTLCVLPDHRRRGIAAALLNEVLQQARRLGTANVFLEVAETNDPARALYASRGFIVGRRRPDYYRGPNRVPTAALEMRRELARAGCRD